jgi:hypothetical protein
MPKGLEAGSAEMALWMIRIIEEDDRLGREIRNMATVERARAANRPPLVISRLERAAADEAERLQLDARPPTSDLARCISVEIFFDWHLDNSVRREFLNAETYRRLVESTPEPGQTLFADLDTAEIVFPGVFSWMIPRSQLAGLDSMAIVTAIQVTYRPPVVVFVLPLELLRRAPSVRVRVPCAIDAIPRRHTTWSRSGLPEGRTELIDSNVPRSAVGGIEWRA